MSLRQRPRRASETTGEQPDKMIDLPAGPDEGQALDFGVLRLTAEQQGNLDQASYDRNALEVTASFPFELELIASGRQCVAASRIQQEHQQQMTDKLEADKHAGRDRVQLQLKQALTAADEAQQRHDEAGAQLSGDGPFADPSRMQESWRQSLLKVIPVPLFVGVAELGINVIALESLNSGLVETMVLAVTIGAAGVLVPHMAGAYARKFRGCSTWRARAARWGLPVAAALGLCAVQAMMAALRTGFLNAPQIDPSTGQPGSPLLTQAGVPAGLVLAGWWALQVLLSLVVAWHAEHTHNPFVATYRRAGRLVRRLRARVAALTEQATQTLMVALSATADRQRITAMFQAQRERIAAGHAQALGIYGREMARQKADPAFTSAMEIRLAGGIPQLAEKILSEAPEGPEGALGSGLALTVAA